MHALRRSGFVRSLSFLPGVSPIPCSLHLWNKPSEERSHLAQERGRESLDQEAGIARANEPAAGPLVRTAPRTSVPWCANQGVIACHIRATEAVQSGKSAWQRS